MKNWFNALLRRQPAYAGLHAGAPKETSNRFQFAAKGAGKRASPREKMDKILDHWLNIAVQQMGNQTYKRVPYGVWSGDRNAMGLAIRRGWLTQPMAKKIRWALKLDAPPKSTPALQQELERLNQVSNEFIAILYAGIYPNTEVSGVPQVEEIVVRRLERDQQAGRTPDWHRGLLPKFTR